MVTSVPMAKYPSVSIWVARLKERRAWSGETTIFALLSRRATQVRKRSLIRIIGIWKLPKPPACRLGFVRKGHRGKYRHPRSQTVFFDLLEIVEDDLYGNALHDLHVIARGVLRRQ